MTEHYMEGSLWCSLKVTWNNIKWEPSWNITKMYVCWVLKCVTFNIKQRLNSLHAYNEFIIFSYNPKWSHFNICCHHQSFKLSPPPLPSLLPFCWVNHVRSAANRHISRSAWRSHLLVALAARESLHKHTQTHAHTHIWCECESLVWCSFITFFCSFHWSAFLTERNIYFSLKMLTAAFEDRALKSALLLR